MAIGLRGKEHKGMLSLDKNNKTPLPPQRMNILGRKRYSTDTGVTDVIECSFDDCWKAIGVLWAVVVGLGYVVFKNIKTIHTKRFR